MVSAARNRTLPMLRDLFGLQDLPQIRAAMEKALAGKSARETPETGGRYFSVPFFSATFRARGRDGTCPSGWSVWWWARGDVGDGGG